MVIDEVAVMMYQFMGGDEPCAINNMDEYTYQDSWCEEYCVLHNGIDCWRHAIEAKWYEKVWADVPRKGW